MIATPTQPATDSVCAFCQAEPEETTRLIDGRAISCCTPCKVLKLRMARQLLRAETVEERYILIAESFEGQDWHYPEDLLERNYPNLKAQYAEA